MPKILLGVSIALISASAVLGFLTKNKVLDLNQNVIQAKESATAASATAAKAQAALKESEVAKAAAAAEAEKANTELASVKSEVQKAKDEAADLQTKLTDLEKKFADKSPQPAPTSGEGNPPPGPDPALVAKIKNLETNLAEKDQLILSLTTKANEAENRTKVLAEKENKRQRQFMAKGLEGQILAVNQQWNFVVLNIGDRQGVIVGAQMIVKRGSQMVGKVKITAVEPSTAIADVIPETLPRGERVVPGDSVVYSGS